jgi:streptogramin lyase
LTATGAVEGQTATSLSASFTDANTGSPASTYSYTITWGDGTSTTGAFTGSGGSYTVSGSHTYADEGSYSVSVVVTDDGGSKVTITGSTTVADAALTGSSTATAGGTEGVSNSCVLSGATFTDANSGNHSTDFTAVIDWGDGGPTSSGTISYSGGTYTVSGSHTYAEEGSYPFRVTVTDKGGSSATLTGTARVAIGQVGQFEEISVGASLGPSAICAGPDNALWFGAETANQIGRTTQQGAVTLWFIPTANAGMGGIITGPDGKIYFTEFKANKVGVFNPATQTFAEYPIPITNSGPGGIIVGSDGYLWIMLGNTSQLVRMTTAGQFLPAYALPSGCLPHGPALGPDGNIWFDELLNNRIARITPAGQLTEWTLPGSNSRPTVLTAARDGMYFTEQAGRIGRINLSTFAITEWTVPTANAVPFGCATGGDGNIYFTERSGNKVGMLPVGGGTITEYVIPTPACTPNKMVVGPDGDLWFTEQTSGKIAEMS